jgi:hypothetical protein
MVRMKYLPGLAVLIKEGPIFLNVLRILDIG